MIVLAHNASGDYGIGREWLTNGLELYEFPKLTCGKPPVPSCNLPNNCSTIWLESFDCSVLNETHFIVRVESLQEGFAQLNVSANVQSLPDGSYGFALYLPVPNSATQQVVSKIDGVFDVTGVAYPPSSELFVCQFDKQHKDVRVNVTVPYSASSTIYFQVLAKDIDGHVLIKQQNSLMVNVINVGTGQRALSEPTSWNNASSCDPNGQLTFNVAAVRGNLPLGTYDVEIHNPLENFGSSYKLSLTVTRPTCGAADTFAQPYRRALDGQCPA